jgi:hypothetical protein
MKKTCLSAAIALAMMGVGSAHATLANGQPYSVSMDAKGFMIDGQYRLLRGGTVQWFRIPSSEWRDRLEKFKAAGFNTVDLYVAWNAVEPREGQFNFNTPNLRQFLLLCKELGLYVYFRPGPYITNEMDGGGIPAWLMAKSTKKDIAADGKPNLRTHDPDYLNYVGKYLRRVNAEVRDLFADRGGPIVLYSVENEYNWFQPFHEADKLFGYQGGPERGLLQSFNPNAYFTALRDIVRNDGITVPITTCPGDGKASATGDVAGVVPVPNIYNGLGGDYPEKTAVDLLTDMHSSNHGGVYANMPSGTTETDRDPVKIKRMLLGGLDATFAFNAVGMMTPGYRNAIVLNTRSVDNAFDFSSINNIMNGFVSPQVGYFSGVIDYYGPISPSGLLRPSFHAFRRDNLFFDAVEPFFASAGTAHKTGLTVSNTEIGAREPNNVKVNYWLQGTQGTRFVGLVNQSGTAQNIPLNGVNLNGETLPKYAPMTVPTNPEAGVASKDYAMILVQDLPLTNSAGKIAWTTSELLTSRNYNNDALVIVHGVANNQGELVLEGLGNATIITRDNGISIAEQNANRLAVSYSHIPNLELVVRSEAGKTVRVVVTTTEEAGRFWFSKINGEDVVVSGLEMLKETGNSSLYNLQLAAEYDTKNRPLFVMSPRRMQLRNLATSSAWNSQTQSATFVKPQSVPALPSLPSLMVGKVASDMGEAQTDYNDSSWIKWTGEPQPQELKGVYGGHSWYRTELNFDHAPYWWEDCSLYIEHASDIVGIYVNGTYLSTKLPLGTELDSDSWNSKYKFPSLRPYLKQGKNVIAFRTEVWGHGSFMWPRGTLAATNMKMPALGFDSLKGLWGTARLGGTNLTNWSLRADLNGERIGLMNNSYSDSAWQSKTLPMSLAKGEVRWYRAKFDAAQLPSNNNLSAPLSLRFDGQRVKATIWLNGQLIGRWLSGDGWLDNGFWGRAIRDMWMNTNPDYLPISTAGLNAAGTPNVIAVAFEDVSSDDQSAAQVNSVSLAYSPEIRADINGQSMLVNQPRGKTVLNVDFLE